MGQDPYVEYFKCQINLMYHSANTGKTLKTFEFQRDIMQKISGEGDIGD
jgi:hypothetical protein